MSSKNTLHFPVVKIYKMNFYGVFSHLQTQVLKGLRLQV